MTTVREIVTTFLTLNDFDGLAGDECGCAADDLFPCDSCPCECEPGYRWECGQCPSAVEERCHFQYGNGGCYRTKRQKAK